MWWQDYRDRVMAAISKARSDMARDRIELRRCRHVPPPSITDYQPIYTDEDYSCGSWRIKE